MGTVGHRCDGMGTSGCSRHNSSGAVGQEGAVTWEWGGMGAPGHWEHDGMRGHSTEIAQLWDTGTGGTLTEQEGDRVVLGTQSPRGRCPLVTSWHPQFSALALKMGILYYGGQLVAAGTVSTGDLVTFLLYQIQFTDVLRVSLRGCPYPHVPMSPCHSHSVSQCPCVPTSSLLCLQANRSVSPCPSMSLCPHV